MAGEAGEISSIGVKLTLDASQFLTGMDAAKAKTQAFSSAATSAAKAKGQLEAGGGKNAAQPNAAQNMGVDVSLTINAAAISGLRKQVQAGLQHIPVSITPTFAETGKFSLPAIMGSMLSMQYGVTATQGRQAALQTIERFAGSIPKKAAGGPVPANRPVIVGEYRPEVIVPRTPSIIHPSVSSFYREQELARQRELEVVLVERARQQQHDQRIQTASRGIRRASTGRVFSRDSLLPGLTQGYRGGGSGSMSDREWDATQRYLNSYSDHAYWQSDAARPISRRMSNISQQGESGQQDMTRRLLNLEDRLQSSRSLRFPEAPRGYTANPIHHLIRSLTGQYGHAAEVRSNMFSRISQMEQEMARAAARAKRVWGDPEDQGWEPDWMSPVGFFHATTNMPSVLSDGLRSGEELRRSSGLTAGLGGNDQFVSTTWSLSRARQLASSMRMASRVARGQVNPRQMANYFRHRASSLNNMEGERGIDLMRHLGQQRSRYREFGSSLDELTAATHQLPKQYVTRGGGGSTVQDPYFELFKDLDSVIAFSGHEGATEWAEGSYFVNASPEQMASADPKNVGVVQLAMRRPSRQMTRAALRGAPPVSSWRWIDDKDPYNYHYRPGQTKENYPHAQWEEQYEKARDAEQWMIHGVKPAEYEMRVPPSLLSVIGRRRLGGPVFGDPSSGYEDPSDYRFFNPQGMKAKPRGYEFDVFSGSSSGVGVNARPKGDTTVAGWTGLDRIPQGLTPMGIEVWRAHQGKGLGSWLYATAEKESGQFVRPGNVQSAAARRMWSDPRRPFGGDPDAVHDQMGMFWPARRWPHSRQLGGGAKASLARQLEARALRTYGETNWLSEAGYISPRGTMLDFSGRSQVGEGGYMGGYKRRGRSFVPAEGGEDIFAFMRDIDHRDASRLFDDLPGGRVYGSDSYNAGMNRMIDAGFYRSFHFDNETGQVMGEFGRPVTWAQRQAIADGAWQERPMSGTLSGLFDVSHHGKRLGTVGQWDEGMARLGVPGGSSDVDLSEAFDRVNDIFKSHRIKGAATGIFASAMRPQYGSIANVAQAERMRQIVPQLRWWSQQGASALKGVGYPVTSQMPLIGGYMGDVEPSEYLGATEGTPPWLMRQLAALGGIQGQRLTEGPMGHATQEASIWAAVGKQSMGKMGVNPNARQMSIWMKRQGLLGIDHLRRDIGQRGLAGGYSISQHPDRTHLQFLMNEGMLSEAGGEGAMSANVRDFASSIGGDFQSRPAYMEVLERTVGAAPYMFPTSSYRQALGHDPSAHAALRALGLVAPRRGGGLVGASNGVRKAFWDRPRGRPVFHDPRKSGMGVISAEAFYKLPLEERKQSYLEKRAYDRQMASFERMSEADIEEARAWYPLVNLTHQAISRVSGIPMERTVGAASTSSPRARFPAEHLITARMAPRLGNLVATNPYPTREMLRAVSEAARQGSGILSGNALRSAEVLAAQRQLIGRKITDYKGSILDADVLGEHGRPYGKPVPPWYTNDIWMNRMLQGNFDPSELGAEWWAAKTGGARAAMDIEAATGLVPFDLQAASWIQTRRQLGKRGTASDEMTERMFRDAARIMDRPDVVKRWGRKMQAGGLVRAPYQLDMVKPGSLLLASHTPYGHQPLQRNVLSGQMSSIVDQIRGRSEGEHAVTFDSKGGFLGHAVGEEGSVTPSDITGRPWWRSPDDRRYGKVAPWAQFLPGGGGGSTRLDLTGATSVHNHPVEMGPHGPFEAWRPSPDDVMTMLNTGQQEGWNVTPRHTFIMRPGEAGLSYSASSRPSFFSEHDNPAKTVLNRLRTSMGPMPHEEALDLINSRRMTTDAKFWHDAMRDVAEQFDVQWEHWYHPRQARGRQLKAFPGMKDGGFAKRLHDTELSDPAYQQEGVYPLSVSQLHGFQSEPFKRMMEWESKPYMASLRQSMAIEGVQEPVDIRIQPDGTALIYDGNHRVIAAKGMGREHIPGRIKSGSNPYPQIPEMFGIKRWAPKRAGGGRAAAAWGHKQDFGITKRQFDADVAGRQLQEWEEYAASKVVPGRVARDFAGHDLTYPFMPDELNPDIWRNLMDTRPQKPIDFGGGVRLESFSPGWDRHLPKPLKKHAGGGRALEGVYLVGEIGPELFVPDEMADAIPKKVMDQIPKAKGGMQVIGTRRDQKLGGELFFPPTDGVIVPNRLMDKVPRAESGVAGDFGGQDLWDQMERARRTGPRTDIHATTIDQSTGRVLSNPTIARGVNQGGVIPVTVQGSVEVGNWPTGLTSQSSASSGTYAMPPAAGGSGMVAMPPVAATPPASGNRRSNLTVPADAHVKYFRGMEAWDKAQPQADAHVRQYRDLEAWNKSQQQAAGSATATTATPASEDAEAFFGQLMGTFRQRETDLYAAGIATSTRTPQGLVAQMASMIPFVGGSNAKQQAVVREQRVASRELEKAAAGVAGADTSRGAAWGNTALAGTSGKDVLRDYLALQDDLTLARGDEKDAIKDTMAVMEDAVPELGDLTKAQERNTEAIKKSLPGLGAQAGNLAKVVASIQVYGMAMQGIGMVAAAASPAVRKMVDQFMGFQAQSEATTTALGKQTREQMGNATAVMNAYAISSNLGPGLRGPIGEAISVESAVKAGAEVAGRWEQGIESALGAERRGYPSGTLVGSQGLFNSALMAEAFGGGKGVIEQLLGAARKMTPSAARFDSGPESAAGQFVRDISPGWFNDAMDSFQGMAQGNPSGITPGMGRDEYEQGLFEGFTVDVQAALERGMKSPAIRGTSFAADTAGVNFTPTEDESLIKEARAAAPEGEDGRALRQLAANGIVLTLDDGSVADAGQMLAASVVLGVGLGVQDVDNWAKEAARTMSAQWEGSGMGQWETGDGTTVRGLARREMDIAIPFGQWQSLMQNPIIDPRAGVSMLGASGSAQAYAERSFAATGRGQGQIQRIADRGLAAQTAEIENFYGAASQEVGIFEQATSKAQGLSSSIARLTTDMLNAQQAAADVSYANQIRLATRALADAVGMLGQAGGSRLGYLQREQWLASRASQSLGLASQRIGLMAQRLSLALQARSIATNLALAQFQAPGETGEERYVRQREAIIRAGIEKQQLGYSQQQYGISTQQQGLSEQQFKIAGEMWAINAQRAAVDAGKTIEVMQASRSAQLIATASQKQIANAAGRMGFWLQRAANVAARASSRNNDMVSAVTQGGIAMGEAFSDIAVALRKAIGQLDGSVPRSQTEGGADKKNRPYATGFYGTFNAPTQATFGEAGAETVAILRNPRTGMLSTGGGGGPTNITINISGTSVRSDDDIDRLANKVARVVERSISRKGEMLGLRQPSY